jgi:uncharacterized protein
MKIRLAACSLLALTFFAADVRADEMADLKARFQSRDAQLTALKAKGALGETYQGFLDSPSGSPTGDAKSLMDAENADRKRLYQLIADKEKTTADVVATRNAKRNFERAASGEMLKFPDGQWRKR